jgi:hypothetical protein
LVYGEKNVKKGRSVEGYGKVPGEALVDVNLILI